MKIGNNGRERNFKALRENFRMVKMENSRMTWHSNGIP